MRKLLMLSLSLLVLCTQLLAQRAISGRVTDDKGNPLPNVSVQIKGSTVGTVTNNDGTYTLTVPANARTLTVSSVGFVAQELNLGSSSSYNVTLNAENQNMDEVVVVAYGTAKKSTFTGSTGQINANEIKNRPIANVTRALEGAVPGVVTTAGSGQPGSGSAIRVRGFGSINATSEPLFVVDGVPYVGGTSNINPDDVESITILKDAASTALYGSRAANGVVVITTKRGQKGRNNISLRIMQGVATRGLPEYERLNAQQYYPIMWEAYRNSLVYPASGASIPVADAGRVASGLYPRIATGTNAGLQNYNGRALSDIRQLLSYNPFNVGNTEIVGPDGQINPNAQLKYGDDLDWMDAVSRTGNRRDYSVNFNGGADKSDYFVSLGYLNEEGYTLKTDFERYSARINVNVQPKKWLRTGLNISGNHSISNTARDGSNTGFVNPFFFTRNIGPIYPVYAHNMTTGAYVLDNNGDRIWDLGNLGATAVGTANGIPNRPSGAFAGRHILGETSLNEQLYKRTVVSARNNVDLIFLKDFRFTNNVAVDFQNQYDASYDNTVVGDGAPAGRADRETGFNTGFTINQLLNYNKNIGRHGISALIGHESFNQILEGQRGFKQGQTVSGNTELVNFTTINATTSYTDRYRIESYFSRVNYDFDGKYLASASIRRDGNSRFSKDARWGTFWSVGAGWRLDREDFLSNVSFINNLKVRGSYGVVGVADDIGYYAWQGLYGFLNNANEPGIIQSQTAFENLNLTWEKNIQSDIGVEFGLFKNRLTGSIEYYNRESKDLLFAVPQPLSSGLLSTLQNTASMYNRGIEVQLGGDIVRTQDFTVNLNINASTVTNKITKMPVDIPEFITGTKKYAVGQSIFEYWLRSYHGVDPADGAALYKAMNKNTTANRRILPNKNGGNDTLTTNSSNALYEYHGTAIPDLYGSFSPTITFKQITLSVLFTFQLGGLTYDDAYAGIMSTGTYGGALHTDILKRWQKPGDVTDVPRMDAGRTADHNAQSTRWLIDASYLNIRSLNIAYNLPKSLTSRVKINSSQFFVSAENLHFFSKRKGMNNQNAFSGVTSNSYPPARVISAGLNLNF
jgi:TonB-linked SusC/RagA family outer membrane protein